MADSHLPALAAFYRQVWDPHATPEGVHEARARAAAANPVHPGEPPPTWLLLQNGVAIAHVTSIPMRLWMHGREQGAYWIKGLWVLPEHQRSAAGFLVLRAAVTELTPALALVHEPAAVRLFQALGFAELGALPNRLRLLDPAAVLRRIDLTTLGVGGASPWLRRAARVASLGAPFVGPLLRAAASAWALLRTGATSGVDVRVEPTLDVREVDELWRSVRTAVVAAPARSGNALVERYPPALGYVYACARAAGRLAGVAIVKLPRADGDPRLRGIRIATVSDLLFEPGNARIGLALLRGSECAALAHGAHAILCGSSAAAIDPLYERRAYLPFPSNLRVLGRSNSADASLAPGIRDWWFTRGDSGGDGSF